MNAQADLLQAQLDASVKGSQDQLAAKQALLEKERELELNQKELTEGQKLQIQYKYDALSRQAQQEYFNDLASERNLKLANDIAEMEMAGQEILAKQLELAASERDQQLANDQLTAEQRRAVELNYAKNVQDIMADSRAAQQADAEARLGIASEIGNACIKSYLTAW